MKTVYYRTGHPKIFQMVTLAMIVIWILIWIWNCPSFSIGRHSGDILSHTISLVLLIYIVISEYSYFKVTIDTEELTMTCYLDKRNPIRIDAIKDITYKENKKGKYRHLTVHYGNVGYTDLMLCKADACRLVAQLLDLNPSIEVKHKTSM